MRAIDTRSYDSNDFYFLKKNYKKEDKLRERLVGVLKDLVNKMEKTIKKTSTKTDILMSHHQKEK